jgi:hypothetical protein
MSKSTPIIRLDAQGNRILNSAKEMSVYVLAINRKRGKQDDKKLYRFINGELDKNFKKESSVGHYKKKLILLGNYKTHDDTFVMHVFGNPKKVSNAQAKIFAMEIAQLSNHADTDFIEMRNISATHVINPNIVNHQKEVGLLIETVSLMLDKLQELSLNKQVVNAKKKIGEIKLIYRLLAPNIDILDSN